MILLDTCAAIWASDGTLSATAKKAAIVAAATDQLFISPITFWEIATLVRKKRLRIDMPIADYMERIEASGVRIAALTPSIARAAGTFAEEFVADPADRIIAATALALDLRLMTRDRALLSVGKLTGLRLLRC